MEEQMTMIRERLKEAQDRQKSYVYAHRVGRSYELGDRVFLRVRPQNKLYKIWNGRKIVSTVCGTF